MTNDSDQDLAALQGQWEQVAFEENGMRGSPGDLGASGSITTFDGCRFSVHTPGGELLLEGTFALDASVRPKAITWTDSIGADAGKRLPASYELNDDRFLFIAAGEGDPRPTAFRTKRGQVMRAFTRKR